VEDSLQAIPEVETAKALLTEAAAWSVMKWLREKKRVRQTADEANAALDRMSETVKQRWPENVRSAYTALSATPAGSKTNSKPSLADSASSAIARKIKEADDEAYRARMTAEEIFDRAEQQLSIPLAREGCRKAIEAWDLQEEAISKAEAVVHP